MFRGLRATAPQTYHTFCTSNGAADVLYVLLKSLTAQGLQACFCLGFESKGAVPISAVDKSTRMFHFVKIAADVRQALPGPWISPQACEKKWISLGEFLLACKKVKNILILYVFFKFLIILSILSISKRGRVSAPISRAPILHRISTIRPSYRCLGYTNFFFGNPLLQLGSIFCK